MVKVAALYARVSTDEQTTENQLSELKQYSEKQGFSETITYSETASGAKDTRTVLDRMMKAVRAGKVDAVIIVKLDRLGRSLQHLLQLIQEFRNKKVQFVSINDGFDTETAAGRLQLQIIGAFAEYERELNRERTNAGLRRAKRQGKRLGRPKGSKDKKPRRKSGYYQRWADEN